MRDFVMVSIPFHDGTHPTSLMRAIGSVVDQSAPHVLAVIVADGCAIPDLGPLPDRVVAVHQLPENRGRYFADAVTLAAAVSLGAGFWMVHDSDDWSEPDHISSLMREMTQTTDVVFGGYVKHSIVGDAAVRRGFDVARSRRLRHGTQYASALWRTKAINAIGGPHPDWRVAWDTMMITLSSSYLRYRVTPNAKYHYQLTAGSLTQSAMTGMRSQIRRTAHHERQVIWQSVRRHARSVNDVGRIVRETMKPETVEAVITESAKLTTSIRSRIDT